MYGGWAVDLTCASICNLIITDTVYPIGADACTLDYTELTTNAPPPPTTNIIFTKNFNGADLPAGWLINNVTRSGIWGITNSSNAGGTANEATLSGGYNSTANGNRILRSPNINIAGQNNLQLNFKQYLSHYSDAYPYSVFIQTKLDGNPWVNQYVVNNVNNDINPETRTIDLSTLSGSTLRFRFRLNGMPFGLYDWSVDDITVTADGALSPPQITWSPTASLYSDSALTTPYAGGFAGTVYATPSGIQLYTATDSNSCTDAVTVIYNKKTWNGSNNDNWYLGDNWTPTGVPTIDNCIVIPDNSSVPNNPIADKLSAPPFPLPQAEARNITLLSGAYFEIKTNTELTVQEWVNVQNTAILYLKSSSSLI